MFYQISSTIYEQNLLPLIDSKLIRVTEKGPTKYSSNRFYVYEGATGEFRP